MKNGLIEWLCGFFIAVCFVSLISWGQTREMCKTEQHKSAAEVEACKSHEGTK